MNQRMDIGYVPCSCGCGDEASQIFAGIAIPDSNPMIHYRNWKYRSSKRRGCPYIEECASCDSESTVPFGFCDVYRSRQLRDVREAPELPAADGEMIR